MCGIYLSLDREGHNASNERIRDLLKQRGPDSQQQLDLSLDVFNGVIAKDEPSLGPQAGGESTSRSTIHISCMASVLSLRGTQTTKQPIGESHHTDATKSSFLCWNGEAWSFASTPVRGNDSSHVYKLLSYISLMCWQTENPSPEIAISEALAAYAGPFAFAFFDHLYQRVYCGRDFLGRRSLLTRRSETGLVISSIPDDQDGWEEIETVGVYWIDLKRDASLVLQQVSYQRGQGDARSSHSVCPFELKLEKQLLSDEQTDSHSSHPTESVDWLQHLLLRALTSRLCTIPPVTTQGLPHHHAPQARVAVLFSGGIDCTILARLSHSILDPSDPIDLLNVAFENPRVHRQSKLDGTSPYEECPDRKTALSSLRELTKTCPGRLFRLIRINVAYEEFLTHRPNVISLIRPHNTEMDLSIAAALYFASRGIGILDDDTAYETHAKVLLSGLGADELFAGYTRHATAYSRGGLDALHDELALDISRLGKRNLGRDDRVISHWAKEARYPFLDEDLVKWALSASLSEKCGFGCDSLPLDPSGVPLDPAKVVIRSLALKLGMPGVAQEKKRAIQFGARTAKMEVKKTKGTHVLTAEVG